MSPQTPRSNPWWIDLMCSTSILLVFCGLPGVPILALWLTSESSLGLSAVQALYFGLYLALAEALTAGTLFFVARSISKRRHRTP